MPKPPTKRLSTGIEELDQILCGGLPEGHIYLVLGRPGSGKTTLGMQFILEGQRQGERTLYITLSETSDEVESVATSHGWSMEGVDIYELGAAEQVLGLDEEQTMFEPTEVHFRRTSQAIVARILETRPSRIVFDSLSELALLSRDPLAFRREILLLKQTFEKLRSTVFLMSDMTTPDADRQLQSLTHGVMMMEEQAPEYGCERRRLKVLKLRGSSYLGGYHDFRIQRGGLAVYPRLDAPDGERDHSRESLGSGVPALDALCGGGLARGSSTLLVGPAGTGKSTVMARFVCAALERGEPAALFLFDEAIDTLFDRAGDLGMPLRAHAEAGRLHVMRVDPGQLAPGELVHKIQQMVKGKGVRILGIDSLNGYLFAMPEEKYLGLHLHDLLSYLDHEGVATMLLLAEHGPLGRSMSPADVTYVADSVLSMRFFEAAGRVKRAISMLKKRHGPHEETIRELRLTSRGIEIGEPLDDFQGVLTGVPRFLGEPDELLQEDHEPGAQSG